MILPIDIPSYIARDYSINEGDILNLRGRGYQRDLRMEFEIPLEQQFRAHILPPVWCCSWCGKVYEGEPQPDELIVCHECGTAGLTDHPVSRLPHAEAL